MILPDGTIMPSFLGARSRGDGAGSQDVLTDLGFRIGEVKKLIWPDDPLSYGKRVVEYEVEVSHRDGTGITHTSTFRGVQTSNLFGGTADRFAATLRADEHEGPGVGARVLMLCVNGNQQQAIIVGALDPAGVRKDRQDAGHNLFFEFNGVRFTVNDDGEATLAFRGATKTDGTPRDGVDADATASIRINKAGRLTLATSTVNSISLDQAQKQIVLLTDGSVEFQADGNVNIKSAGVVIGDGTNSMLLGTAYRTAEAGLHAQMMTALAALGTALTASGQALNAAGIDPVFVSICPIAAGAVVTAGIGIAGAASLVAGLQSQVAAFEAQASTFLSAKNRHD